MGETLSMLTNVQKGEIVLDSKTANKISFSVGPHCK